MRVACLEAHTLEACLGGVLLFVCMGVGRIVALPLSDELCDQQKQRSQLEKSGQVVSLLAGWRARHR